MEEEEASNGRRAVKEKARTDSRENSGSRKKSKPNTKSDNFSSKALRRPLELETDSLILQRRQKQIDYGKNTVGYNTYIKKVPLDKRTRDDPQTPDKYAKYSRRSWDQLIKLWRKKLHEYDLNPNSIEDSDVESENEHENFN